MDPLTSAAASGMRARMESLELLANNLANAGTSGYKADREFYNLYADEAMAAGPLPAMLPVIESHWTDFTQGTLKATGNPLDLALSGDGFFAADSPSGVVYTRNGSFRLSREGALVTAEGYRVRGRDGRPIQVDPGRPFEVTREGAVMQGGQLMGNLEILDFDRGALNKAGGNYFRLSAPDARSRVSPAEVLQGHSESANFAAAETAVRLVSVMRQFEMLQRAMVLGGEMSRRAVEEVARAS
jgi:flagellar basal body rod protein FlgG